MSVCAQVEVERGARSLLPTQSSAACRCGGIAVGKYVLVPGPRKALRGAFPVSRTSIRDCFHVAQTKEQKAPNPGKLWVGLSLWELLFLLQCYSYFKGAFGC